MGNKQEKPDHLNQEDQNEEEPDYDDEEEDEDDNISRDGGYASDPEIGTAKRSIKFKEGASPSSKRDRAQSAKHGRQSYGERDLR